MPNSLLALPRPGRLRPAPKMALVLIALCAAYPLHALDLVSFSGITGPMTSARPQISALGPGIKALVGFVGKGRKKFEPETLLDPALAGGAKLRRVRAGVSTSMN